MKKDTRIATTVKLENNLYDDFKIKTVRKKLTLQTFVERCVNLYLIKDSFQSVVDEFVIPKLSHSGSFGS